MPTPLGGPVRAALTSLAALALAGSTYLSWTASVGVVLVLTCLFALAWPSLLSVPAPMGARVVLLGATAASFAGVYVSGDLRYLAVVTAFGVVAAFVRELARTDGRDRLVESLAATVTGVVVIASAAGWVAIGSGPIQVATVLSAAVALAAASACSAFPFPPWPLGALTIVVATAVGVGVGLALVTVGALGGGLIGLATGIASATLHVLLERYPTAGRLPGALAAATLPVIVLGLPVDVVLRVYLI